ncbi:hypothetical protein BLNAU_5015 [Blattamonas nauphoetae]|uniref:Uncharacterized protein n=1 Tax=Blattamonas nauphoetae TaxID=2049346 RepID=A0ABQ9Y8P1_9EUKA|nr:hypothetical protein BLNAU_5015 [Blattamonas nauphoetae]
MSFEDKSAVYNSLVTLVKVGYPFNKTLQDRAAGFLEGLDPHRNKQVVAKLVTDLVPSSTGSDSGFVTSITTLLSSPHSTVVAATLSFLYNTIIPSSTIQCQLVGSDLISKVLATLQPHTLTISGNEEIYDNLIWIVDTSISLTHPDYFLDFDTISAIDQFNHHEMIFQKAVLPSSQFVSFLISNRHILNGDVFNDFMDLLRTLIRMCPYHRPTLEFVLASPIVMALPSCTVSVEDAEHLWNILYGLNTTIFLWEREGPEVFQTWKQILPALISESYEDTLEMILRRDNENSYGCFSIIDEIAPLIYSLGWMSYYLSQYRLLDHHIDTSRLSRRNGMCPAFPPFQHHPLFKSPSIIVVNKEPFLSFDPKSKLSFDDQSSIYHSLVALVKAEYPFDETLQDKAAQFLKGHESKFDDQQTALKVVTELVPSSAGSPRGFVPSIVTLLSSPHLRVVGAALSFLFETTTQSSPPIRCRLVESDLISKAIAIVQPHTLPLSGNEAMINKLNWVIIECLRLAIPFVVSELHITDAVDKYNHHEVIFQKVVIPSSQYVSFLISNRHSLNEDLFDLFMDLLYALIRIGPLHRPTLEYVLTSPIVMTLSSCLSFVESVDPLYITLAGICEMIEERNKEGAEVVQSTKRMIQALFSEGFEDTLEQTLMKYNYDDYYCSEVVEFIHRISQSLGLNA